MMRLIQNRSKSCSACWRTCITPCQLGLTTVSFRCGKVVGLEVQHCERCVAYIQRVGRNRGLLCGCMHPSVMQTRASPVLCHCACTGS
jgi:hypothetical protein